MVQYHSDWEKGHTPVTTGRAPWLTVPFVQAMHCISSLVRAEEAKQLDRAKAGRRG